MHIGWRCGPNGEIGNHLREPITPGRTVANRYMQWLYKNGKPFIMTAEARARVLRVPRPERPRQQRGSCSTGASTGSRQRTGAPPTSVGPGSTAEGPSTEPYTPMPPFFIHASSSQFQYTMTPPTEGFFAEAFQPYSAMMSAPLHSPGHFFPSPHQFQTSVAPLAVYPPQGPVLGFTYGMVQHTPPGSLFESDPSETGHHEEHEDEMETDEDDDDKDALVQKNPRRNRRPPPCGTGDIGDIS
ncbi:hypothetical protein V6N13_016695 [Hibiscus sabdariffa]